MQRHNLLMDTITSEHDSLVVVVGIAVELQVGSARALVNGQR